jgi:hypothetical protein
MKIYRLAIIGSRETDAATMKEMYDQLLLGVTLLLERGYKVEITSGGCWKGPDQIQFTLARVFTGDSRVTFICYLPDEKKMWLRTKHPNVEFRAIPRTALYNDIVRSLHPAPDYLDDWSFALHGRNLNIIMGDELRTPVDAVYYSAPLDKRGNPKGGTAMGVAYAKSVNVPTYHHGQEGQKWLDSVRLL